MTRALHGIAIVVLGHAHSARLGPQLRTITSRHKLIGLCLGRPALVVTLPERDPRRAYAGPNRASLRGA